MKEIVIRIPEKMYSNFIKRKAYYEVVHEQSSIDPSIELTLAVINGKVLPKGHGELKDTNKIINDGISKGFCDWYDEIKYAEVLIEADKGEE